MAAPTPTPPSGKVSRLFGESPGPRHRRAMVLLVVALPLDLLGLVSCSSLPGAVLTLWAWQLVTNDLQRVEEGQLSVEHAPRLNQLRQVAFVALLWCAFTFVVQLVLLSSGRVEALLRAL